LLETGKVLTIITEYSWSSPSKKALKNNLLSHDYLRDPKAKLKMKKRQVQRFGF